MCVGVGIDQLRQDGSLIINIEDFVVLFVVCHTTASSTYFLWPKRGNIYFIIISTIKIQNIIEMVVGLKTLESKFGFSIQ